MKRTIILAATLAAALAFAVRTQDKPAASPFPSDWMSKNAFQIRSIELKDTDYSDLEPIGRSIGDANVVMLGEQSHGDGATFQAKCRLVRYLHEKKGFDVLAWESGLYDCREADRALAAGEPALTALQKGVFQIWMGAAETQSLVDYLGEQRRGPHPLEVAGFDCQFSSVSAPQTYFPAVIAFFDAVDKSLLTEADRDALNADMDFLTSLGTVTAADLAKKADAFNVVLDTFAKNRVRFVATHGESETAFMERTLRNFRTFIDLTTDIKNSQISAASNNARDLAMAQNLAFLMNDVYKGKKIIVWAASFHTARKLSAIQDPGNLGYASTVTMGESLAKLAPKGIYSIAFSGYEGQAAPFFSKPRKVAPAPVGSLEETASKIDAAYLFCVLKNAPKIFSLRALGNADMTGNWRQNFDAVFYTRKLTPATPNVVAGK